jgi:hypothetical protein
MTDEIQTKRAAINLQSALLDERTKDASMVFFAGQLTTYAQQLLDPELSDGEALAVRFKAIGVVETMEAMGAELRHVMDGPVRKAAERKVRAALGNDQPWS